MKIAMWSGPRNLSTAMMYSFGARSDCAVWDEPYYAAYLKTSGIVHPMGAQIIAENACDPAEIARRITGPTPDGRAIYYQKHMAHHMLPGFDLGWLAGVKNVFLIRHPNRVIASYAAKRENPGLMDLGFVQQAALLDHVVALGQKPIVIDSADIRANPESALRGLCDAIGIAFDRAMLRWPAGGNPNDGVWGKHWYGAVHQSTGFAGPEADLPELSGQYAEIAREACVFYERLQSLKT